MTQDPQIALRDSITLIAAEAAKRGFVLNRVKLVKLLYFLDLRAWKELGHTVTGAAWRWDNCGPNAATIVAAYMHMADCGELETKAMSNSYGSPEYRIQSTSPRYFFEPSTSLVALAVSVVEEYGLYTASSLSDLAYKTEPMLSVQQDAHRGDLLEFPATAPSPTAMQRTIARYARLAHKTEGEDSGDVASALREDMRALHPARSSAMRLMFEDE